MLFFQTQVCVSCNSDTREKCCRKKMLLFSLAVWHDNAVDWNYGTSNQPKALIRHPIPKKVRPTSTTQGPIDISDDPSTKITGTGESICVYFVQAQL